VIRIGLGATRGGDGERTTVLLPQPSPAPISLPLPTLLEEDGEGLAGEGLGGTERGLPAAAPARDSLDTCQMEICQ